MPKPYKDELYEGRAYSVAEVAQLRSPTSVQ